MSEHREIARSISAPGQRGPGTLKFRAGTHPSFLRKMLQRMRQRTLMLSDGAAFDNALEALNPYDENAFGPALLSAWATVCDVLSFYQERIANEGYLATATESASLHELVRSIGYRPAPALSATTHLAFTMIDAKGAPTKLVVPRGTAVQSVPLPGETQVTFETDEDIEVRPEWNTLAANLRRVTVASQIVGRAKQLAVAGVVTTVRPGMPVLLHGKTGPGSQDLILVRPLTRIEPNPTERTTLLGWDEPLAGDPGQPLMEAPEALVFRQSARLFGATAPDWTRQPEAVKAQYATRIGDVATAPSSGEDWTSVAAGLPPGEVRALAVGDDGTIVAAIGNAVVVRAAGAGWIATADLPVRSEPAALAVAANGHIYLGTQRGDVLSSADRGATWFNLASAAGDATAPAKRLPAVPVQALFVADGGRGGAHVVAGTPVGIWAGTPNGAGWKPWNAGLPGYDPKSGGATAAAHAFACDAMYDRWVTATEQGLFYANSFGGYWYPGARAPEGETVAQHLARLCQWIKRLLHLPPKPQPAGSEASAASALAATAPAAATTPSTAQSAAALSSGDQGANALTGPANALAILTGSTGVTFFAATKQGIWRSRNGGLLWRPAATQPGGAPAAVNQLTAARDGLLAGTEKGLFRSADGGETWVPVSGPFAGRLVVAMAAASGLRVAAARFGGYPGADWPNFETTGQQVDLDRPYESLIPGSWIVLAQSAPGANARAGFAAARVVTASTLARRDFLLNDRITRVTLDRDLPHAFNPRTATVFLNSRVLDAVNPTRHHVDILGLALDAAEDSGAPMSISLAGPVSRLNDRLISITGQRAGARFTSSAGGVRRWDGSGWTKLGSFDSDGRALLVMHDGTILLGTRNGVQRFDGTNWQGLGELREEVNVLAELANGDILAGTEHGLWRWKDPAWRQSGLAQRRIFALLAEDASVIAGTDRGLDTSTDGGISWVPASGTVARLAVTALARTRSRLLVAGTENDGLFVATAGDWGNAAHVLPEQPVRSLARDSKGRVFAATANGIFSSDDGLIWSSGPTDVGQGDMRALAFDPHNDDLYAAQRGVAVMTQGHALWAGLANDIRSLAFDRGGGLLASSASSTVLLSADDSQTAALEPQFVADVTGDDLVQRLMTPGRLAGDLRHIFLENKITLPQKAEVRVLADWLKWRISDGKTFYILHALGSQSVRVFAEGDLEVLAWPKPVAERPDLELWRVRNKDGVVADLQAIRPVAEAGKPRRHGEIVFTSAAATNTTVAEIRKVAHATIAGDRSRTDVSFTEPLENVYDAATVTFNANVAPASHGETPPLYEVIGSGDSSVPNQSFTLKRKPITARPSDTRAWHYEITVRVRGSFQSDPLVINEQLIPEASEEDAVEWKRVETLTLSRPSDLHYVLEENDDSSIVLTFGDGKHGKRLPTGAENVIALYRTGSGREGNVEAGRLTLLRKRPAGIQKVTNPARAIGGTLSEIDASIRRAAPIAVRTLGRIVSLRDHHDFARAWPGIGKVAVRSLDLPQTRAIHITVADVNDGGRTADDSQGQPGGAYPDLLHAIKAHRASGSAVLLDRYVPRPFRIEADIAADPKRRKAVSAAVSAMLLDRYGFARRTLAQPVTAADVMAAMQKVPGVQAVHLRSLHILGAKSALLGTLQAAEAHWDDTAQAVHPAELLFIASETDIVLGGMTS